MGTYELFFCHSMNAGSVVGIPCDGGTLKPYCMLKNLFEFELTVFKGDGDKNFWVLAVAPGRGGLLLCPLLVLALAPMSHLIFNLSFSSQKLLNAEKHAGCCYDQTLNFQHGN